MTDFDPKLTRRCVLIVRALWLDFGAVALVGWAPGPYGFDRIERVSCSEIKRTP